MQAYLLWEKAGKPDGANFSDDARRQLQQQLESGRSVQDLERSLKGGQPEQKAPEAPKPAPVSGSASVHSATSHVVIACQNTWCCLHQQPKRFLLRLCRTFAKDGKQELRVASWPTHQ